MEAKKALPVLLKPLSEMDHAEKLDHATGLALDETIYVFNLPRDPAALEPLGLDAQKVARMKLELLQTVMSTRVKVDDAALRHQERSDLLDLLRERLDNLRLPKKDD